MSLALRKTFALRDIDDAAGEARLRYITDVPGQQAVYMLKLAEAEAYVAAHALDAQAVPGAHLAAEATATEQTALEVAQTVITLATLWNTQLSPAIEGLRLGGKAAVTAAEDIETVNAARAAAITALQAV